MLFVYTAFAGCNTPILRSIELPAQPNDGLSCTNGGIDSLMAEPIQDQVNLSWVSVATNEDGVQIERRAIDQPAWAELARVPAKTRTFADTSIRANSTYLYRVKMFRGSGGSFCASDFSDETQAMTVPGPPESLQATIESATRIRLSWQDRNLYETGYQIERQTNGNGFVVIEEILNGNYTFDATSLHIAYLDTTVVLGDVYEYRVSAFLSSTGGQRLVSTPAFVTQRASNPPTLQWTDAPYLENDCTLVLPGNATFDAQSGAVFSSSTANVDGPCDNTSPQATAQGGRIDIQSKVYPNAQPATLSSCWQVEDDKQSNSTIQRDLTLSTTATQRAVSRRPTLNLGDDNQPGRQALMPGCSSCTETRGMISVGGSFACAIDQNGRAKCWGDNRSGQNGLGDPKGLWPNPHPVCGGTTSYVNPCDTKLTATDIAVTRTPISGYADHACVITTESGLRCWGDNLSGQLGDGTTREQGTPVDVCSQGTGRGCTKLTGVKQVALGARFSCAIVDTTTQGAVLCWGKNTVGQLGIGSASNTPTLKPTPVCISGAWDETKSQCYDSATNSAGTPLVGATSITAGTEHACAVVGTNNDLYCWGENGRGQLGIGLKTDQSNATLVTTLTDVKSASAARYHTCAVLNDGMAKCWGKQSNGRLGNGSPSWTDQLTPTNVCSSGTGSTCVDLAGVKQIATGLEHACALVGINNEVMCWGSQSSGRLGNGKTSGKSINPISVCDSASTAATCTPLTGAQSLVVAKDRSCAIMASGSTLCWGNNTTGSLGTGNTTAYSIPTPICQTGSGSSTCVPNNDFTAIAVGLNFGCAISSGTQEVSCWGSNQWDGHLGRGSSTRQRVPMMLLEVQTTQPPVPPMLPMNVKSISVGAAHGCAIEANGTLVCWGYNAHGETGSDPTDTYIAASAVSLQNVIAVSAGGALTTAGLRSFGHTCAVTDDGHVWCWGDNRKGQLGNGSIETAGTATHQPQEVICGTAADGACSPGTALAGVVDVEAGYQHTCVVTKLGRIRCWGDNAKGQLGNGQLNDSLIPIDTPIIDALAVTTGRAHTCALVADGTVQCWGDNANGQLGEGSSSPFMASPKTVCAQGSGSTCQPLSQVVGIVAGDIHTCALHQTGTVHCWGDNSKGQLGNGTNTFSNQPIKVCGDQPLIVNDCSASDIDCTSNAQITSVVAIDAGFRHTCALKENGTIVCWGSSVDGQLGIGDAGSGNYRCTPTSSVCFGDTADGPCDTSLIVSEFTVQTCHVATVETQ